MVHDPGVQKCKAIVFLYFYCKLNGLFNDVQVCMESCDLVLWQGCECVIHIALSERDRVWVCGQCLVFWGTSGLCIFGNL